MTANAVTLFPYCFFSFIFLITAAAPEACGSSDRLLNARH